MEERKLDFENNKVQALTLDELKQTYKETAPNGNPYNGVYHYEALEAVMSELGAICEPELQEIFAANNGDSRAPGVSVIRDLVPTLGEGALGVHTLRRVYANIDTHIEINKGITLHVAFSYNQRGIIFGVGPHVHVCHNQTILRAEDLFSTYMAGMPGMMYRATTFEGLLKSFTHYLQKFADEMQEIRKMYELLKSKIIDYNMALEFFGCLLRSRVAFDSRNKEIRSSWLYPLTQTQINKAMENWMVEYEALVHPGIVYEDDDLPVMNCWTFLNCLNTEMKPDRADIPYLMPHMLALTNMFFNFMTRRIR